MRTKRCKFLKHCAEIAKSNRDISNFTVQQPSPKCRSILKITTEMKDVIVDLHNTFRNQQALGQTGFPTAARMATVVCEVFSMH